VRRSGLSSKQAPAIVGGLLAVAWLAVVVTHHDQLQSSMFGIAIGAMVAAVALSVVLTYRGSGLVNFSVAAMAMYGAFIFFDLWQFGTLFFPPPIPNWQVVGVRYVAGNPVAPMPVWVAFVASLAICGLMGLLFHFLIFRPLRKAPQLARVVASIGLYLMLFAIISLKFPSSEGFSFPAILPTGAWHLGSYVIIENQFWLLAIVLIVAAILWAVFRFTKFGIATRAAAENERGALILGYNPDRLAAVNWVLSMVLAGAFGILFATSNTTIDNIQILTLIVPVLAAALVGGFRSFPIVVVAALLFGASQSWLQDISGQSWAPSFFGYQNLSIVIPFIAIIVVLFFKGERLPSRGTDEALRMPRAVMPRHPWIGMAFVGITVMVLAFTLNPSWRQALEITLAAAVVCSSLTVLTGFLGQISLMQMTLGGIAALVLSKFCDAHGIPFPFAPIIAAGGATIMGLIAAVPALRIRGVNLAVVTFAAAFVIEQFVYNIPAFQSGFSAGSQTNIGPPTLFGVGFGPLSRWTKILGHPSGPEPDPWFAVFCLVVLGLVILGILLVRRSNLGRRMLAVRSNERAAAASGVSVPMTKLIAFAISAFIAGIGGTLFGYLFSGVDTATLGSVNSLLLIAVAYLGGIALIEGSMVSGLLFYGGIFSLFLSNIVNINVEYAVYIAGVGLIFASINNREGIAGTIRERSEQLRRRRQDRRLRTLPAEPTAVPAASTALHAGAAGPPS
jgi:branched-chain amino acid transport system permease protein